MQEKETKNKIQNETQQTQGFTIIDKRTGASKPKDSDETKKREDTKSQEIPNKKEDKQKQETKESPPLPEVDFTSFIISLSTSAYIHLGEILNPVSNKKDINLPMAKQTIDILTILKEKTEGNRTKQEDKMLEDILYSLRMSFIAASNKNPNQNRP